MRPALVVILGLACVQTASCKPGPPGGGGGGGGGKPPPPDYSTGLETELRELLFDNYSKYQRPQKRVQVRLALNLMSINYLDIKDQSLSISGYFTMIWFDNRLRWNDNENFTNIPFLFSSETLMWRPAVIVENSINDIDVISRPNVPLRIKGDGLVIWSPGGVFVTHCESDITYYPLDTQVCDISLSTWAYTANEVSLIFDRKPFGLDFFKEHGEWDLIATSSSTEETERDAWSFSRLKFSLTIRRRPLFHTLNTLFPVVLMAFLTVVIFKLPPQSGERIGLSLTILLAFAVYLTLISESIPQTSLSASLLSSYLASILLLQTVAVILTVIVLDIYFTPDNRPVPKWLKSVARCLYAVFSCGCCRNKATSVVTPEPDYLDDLPKKRHTTTDGTDTLSVDSLPGYVSESEIQYKKSEGRYQEALNMRNGAITGSWISSNTNDVHEYTWKEIACVFDKACLYLYLLTVIMVTVTCMGIMWYHFCTDYN